MLKAGESGFPNWRKSFDLQVIAVWTGLDLMRDEIRGHDFKDVIIGERQYLDLGSSTISCHLPVCWTGSTSTCPSSFVVLYTHCGLDPIKVLQESTHRCGF